MQGQSTNLQALKKFISWYSKIVGALLPKSVSMCMGISMREMRELSPANVRQRKNMIAMKRPAPSNLLNSNGILERGGGTTTFMITVGYCLIKAQIIIASAHIPSPYERETSVPLSSSKAQCVHNLILAKSLGRLDSKDGGEDEDTTHEADDIVEERSHTAQLDRPLLTSHECSIRQKCAQSSSCNIIAVKFRTVWKKGESGGEWGRVGESGEIVGRNGRECGGY